MHVIIILVVYSCVLDVTYFRPRCSFSAASCPTFVAFLEPLIQSAIDRLLPTPAHQSKALQTIESVRGLCCVLNLKINTGATFEKLNQQICFHLRVMVCLLCEVPIFVWVLINGDIVFVLKMVPIFMGAFYPDFTVSAVC